MAAPPPHAAPSTNPTLVLLGAGVGSRFGGIKPLAPVGPNGEPLLIVSLGQARAAGFDHAVIVVSELTEHPIREALADAPLACTFVRQSLPAGRTKPLGTVDAVISAASVGIGGDVVVANGDDLYGTAGLHAARTWITTASAHDGAAILYRIERTLPSSGTGGTDSTGGVSRATIEHDAHGCMARITERLGVARRDGVVTDATGAAIAPGSPVSMNLWCLRRRAIELLRDARDRFQLTAAGEAELGLPHAIDALVREQRLRIDTVVTDSPWHGVTWARDVADVRAALTNALTTAHSAARSEHERQP